MAKKSAFGVLAKHANTGKAKTKKASVPEVQLPDLSEPITNSSAKKLRTEFDELVEAGGLSPALAAAVKIEGEYEEGIITEAEKRNTPFIIIVNKSDLTAVSLPDPTPFTLTSTFARPCS